MINPGSFENFGDGLSNSSKNAVYKLLAAITQLNKNIAKDPDNIMRYKKVYDKQIAKIAKDFDKDWKKWADEDIAKSYLAGVKYSEEEMRRLGLNQNIVKDINNGSFLIDNPPIATIPEIPGQTLLLFKEYENHPRFFGVFRNAAYYGLEKQKFQIIRKANDIYRQSAILAAEKTFQESNIFTRLKYSQEMLNELSKKGIQTITYKNGAKYSLDTYCEMVGRTLTGRAALQASLNRFFESGYTLVVVSSHFRACDLCTPYEGKTLSIEKHPVYESVDDAETQGLFHPRCKHNVSVTWEGKKAEPPRLDHAEQKLVDEYGYQNAQKMAYSAQLRQRQIERNIRNYKRRSQVSLTQDDKRKADLKVKYWQAKQREHLKSNTFLNRKYSSEQIGKAH